MKKRESVYVRIIAFAADMNKRFKKLELLFQNLELHPLAQTEKEIKFTLDTYLEIKKQIKRLLGHKKSIAKIAAKEPKMLTSIVRYLNKLADVEKLILQAIPIVKKELSAFRAKNDEDFKRYLHDEQIIRHQIQLTLAKNIPKAQGKSLIYTIKIFIAIIIAAISASCAQIEKAEPRKTQEKVNVAKILEEQKIASWKEVGFPDTHAVELFKERGGTLKKAKKLYKAGMRRWDFITKVVEIKPELSSEDLKIIKRLKELRMEDIVVSIALRNGFTLKQLNFYLRIGVSKAQLISVIQKGHLPKK